MDIYLNIIYACSDYAISKQCGYICIVYIIKCSMQLNATIYFYYIYNIMLVNCGEYAKPLYSFVSKINFVCGKKAFR